MRITKHNIKLKCKMKKVKLKIPALLFKIRLTIPTSGAIKENKATGINAFRCPVINNNPSVIARNPPIQFSIFFLKIKV